MMGLVNRLVMSVMSNMSLVMYYFSMVHWCIMVRVGIMVSRSNMGMVRRLIIVCRMMNNRSLVVHNWLVMVNNSSMVLWL